MAAPCQQSGAGWSDPIDLCLWPRTPASSSGKPPRDSRVYIERGCIAEPFVSSEIEQLLKNAVEARLIDVLSYTIMITRSVASETSIAFFTTQPKEVNATQLDLARRAWEASRRQIGDGWSSGLDEFRRAPTRKGTIGAHRRAAARDRKA